MEPEMEFYDHSPWHHLNFVEELADDVRDEEECNLCWEQAVGPVYKCLECDFIQHKSCPNPTQRNWEGRMKNHYYEQRHHLMLVEKVENRAEEEVVCWGCQEIASLPAYKCSLPGCTFLLHKSCAELSHAVLHPQHSDHVLTLQARDLRRGSRGKDKRCNACNKLIECLYYGCRRCNVYLHPKCSAPEMELEVEPQPPREDLSPWHHLIFVEELADDVSDEANCSLCCGQAVGPVYRCLECHFVQHKSCTSDMVIKHGLTERHHLIVIEELGNNDEEVICLGCNESASFPAYKCSIPNCTFFLDKACIQLSHAIQHPVLPNHILILRVSGDRGFCDACAEWCRRSLCYLNSSLDFELHIKCVSCWRTRADDCHKHEVIPTRKPIPFTCEACGEKGGEHQDIAYLCRVCKILTHIWCVPSQPIVKTIGHNHLLTRTYSIGRFKRHDRIFCNICREKVNSEYGAYYCQDCDYIIHFKCARLLDSETLDLDNPPSDFVYLVEGTNATEDQIVGPQEISHFSHPDHNLMLCYERPRDDMRCEVCIQRIVFSPFYSCQQCKFLLHWRCAKIPRIVKRGLFHNHPLTLLSEQSHNESSLLGLFQCKYCHRGRHGFIYKCGECEDFELDVQCCLVPEQLENQLHEHTLFLAVKGGPFKCDGCDYYETFYKAFKCTDCRFHLCFRCVTLPPIARHRFDAHLLRLSLGHDNDPGNNYCLICEKERDPRLLFYYCKECDFTVHSHCVIGRNPYFKPGRPCMERLYHEHPLVFAETTDDSPPCDVCGESFALDGSPPCNVCGASFALDGYVLDRHFYLALKCTQCKLLIHYWCRHCLQQHTVN